MSIGWWVVRRPGTPANKETAMRFMMIVKPPAYTGTPDPKQMAAMGRYNEELRRAGVLLELNGLHPARSLILSTREGVRALPSSRHGGRRRRGTRDDRRRVRHQRARRGREDRRRDDHGVVVAADRGRALVGRRRQRGVRRGRGTHRAATGRRAPPAGLRAKVIRVVA